MIAGARVRIPARFAGNLRSACIRLIHESVGLATLLSARIRLINDAVGVATLLSASIRLIHEAVGVAAARIRLIHGDQLAGRRISLING